MISLRENLVSQGEHTCTKCGGSGTVEVFRNDWEEFDEIKCDKCATN